MNFLLGLARCSSALGFAEAERVETSGHPGVWGYYDASAEKTLMVYMMYDVQPVDPEDWRSCPRPARCRSSAGPGTW